MSSTTFKILLTLLGVAFFLLGDGALRVVYAATCNSQNGGVNSNWNTIGNWSCGRVPTITDDVVITSAQNITIDSAPNSVISVTINNSATLNGGSATLTIGNTAAAGTSFTNNGTFTAGTGTVNFSSNAAVTLLSGSFTGSNKFYNFGITTSSSTGRTYTAGAAVDIGNNFNFTPTGSGGTDDYTLNLSAAMTVTGAITLNHGANASATLNTTVSNYALTAASITLSAANNILTANGSVVTLTGTSGTLFTNSGTFNGNSAEIDVTSASGAPTIFSAATTLNILKINSTATVLNLGADVSTGYSGDNKIWIASGVLNQENRTISTIAVGELRIDSGGTLCLGGTTGSTTADCLSGAAQTTAQVMPSLTTYTFDAASTVKYLCDAATTVSSTPTYGNLVLAPKFVTTSRIYTLGTAMTINGDFTMNPDESGASAPVLSVYAGGTITVASGKTTTLTGTNSATSLLDMRPSLTDYNLSTGLLSVGAAGTLDLTSAASTITLSGTGTVFSMNASGTINPGTSTIKLTNTSSSSKTFAGAGKTYANFWYAPGAGTGSLTITGSNTFTDFKDDGSAAHTDNFTAGTTTTITTWTVSGSAGNMITLQSTSGGSAWNLSDTTGTNTCSSCVLQDSAAAGGATWNAPLSTDVSGNSGWDFLKRYWVGGTASWDGTAGTKWATSSGGAGGSSIPTSTSTVYFDGSSGSGTVTLAAGNTGAGILSFSGFTGTLSGSAAISISGALTLGSGMTNSYTGAMTFNATSGTHAITSNGKSFGGTITFDGVGGTWQPADAFSSTSSLTLTNGTLNTNGQTVSATSLSSSNSNTRTITLGASVVTLTSTGTVWDVATATNLTVTAGTSTIKFTNNSASGKTFAGGGKTYNNFWYAPSSGTGSLTITGSNTFADFKDDGSVAHSILFTNGTTTTVTTFTVSGSAGNLITINSDTTATHSLVKSGGGTISRDYLNIQHSVATPASTWYAGTNSTNNQAVATAGSGWTFTDAPRTLTISSSATSNAGSAPNWVAGVGGGNVNVTDIQTQINAGTSVSFTAVSSITVSSAVSKTSGGDVTMTMYSDTDIIVSASISATTGKLGMLLNADRDASTSGYINIAAALTSNGGNITIGGGSGTISAGSGFAVGNSGQAIGVYINGVTVAAGGGNVIVNGQGYNTTTNNNIGVRVTGASGAITTTGTGTINITGNGAGTSNSTLDYGLEVDGGGIISTVNGNLTVSNSTGGGAGTGGNNYGAYVTGANSTIKTTGSGNLSVTGTGGNGTGGFNVGVMCASATICIQTTGTGTLSITGTGGAAAGAGINNHGIYISDSDVSGSGGAMTLTGTKSNGIGDQNDSVRVSDGSPIISNTGTGSLTIVANGGSTGNSILSRGLSLDVGAIISTVDGNLTVTATGGGAGTGTDNYGIDITDGTIKTTGSGNLSVTGTGGNPSGSGGLNYGVYCLVINCIQTTGTGTMTVTGTGGNGSGSGGSNYGVLISTGASITGVGGAMTLNGTGGNSSGTTNNGIYNNGGTISNTGTGTINVTATGAGNTNSGSDYGLWVQSGGVISTVNGNLTVTATGGGAGAGTNNYGAYVSGASSAIKTTGSGNLSVTGIRGGGDTATNYGINIAIANGLQTTSTGTITAICDTILMAQANDMNSIGDLTIKPYTASTTVGVGAGSGTLALTDTFLTYITWGTSSTLTIGGITAGNIAINTSSTILNKSVSFITGGNISLATTALAHAGASAATLTMKAYGNITLNSAITAATSALTVLLQSDFDASSSGYLSIGAAITSNGGNITLGGGSGTISAGSGFAVGNSGQVAGVFVNSVTVAAAGGNIIVNGQGYNTTTDGNYGVRIAGTGNGFTTTGSGTINITATGAGNTNSGSDYGLWVQSGGVISTVDGNLTITAAGGGAGIGVNNYGVYVSNASSTIKTTGSGNLSVTGIRGGGDTATNYGINIAIANGFQTTSTGTITAICDTILMAEANDINSIGNLTIRPYTASTTIGVGAGSGTLALTDTLLTYIAWGTSSTLTIGGTSAGDISINSSSTILNKNVTFLTGGNISLATTALAHAGASAATLTMQAYGNITTTSAITAATTALTINLNADYDANASGNLSMGAAVGSNSGTISILGGVTLSGGGTFDNLTYNSSGNTLTLGAALTVTNGLTITAGTLDTSNASNYAISASSLTVANSASAILTSRASTISLTGTGTVFSMGASGVINPGTSTIKLVEATGTATAKTFAGGGKTYGNIWFAPATSGTSTGSITMTGSNTFADFKDDNNGAGAAHSILFTNGTTTTVTTFTVSGSAGNLISINSDNTATHSLVKSGGGTISRDYLNIQHSVATPASTWYAGTNSTNNQAVATAGSGWTFTAPPISIKAINGLAQASIKTVNGLAIGSMKARNALQ